MMKGMTLWVFVLLMVCFTASSVFAKADKTTYPVIFAHGLLGFDEMVGIDYFGNDYGVFVGDACDEFLEISCNRQIEATSRHSPHQ